MGIWFQKGQQTAVIPIDDRGLQYSDGLFETIALRNGHLRLWALHVQRLQIACRRLGIVAPDAPELEQICLTAVRDAGFDGKDGLLKIMVTRGTGERGYRPPADPDPTVLIGVFERTARAVTDYSDGIEIRICNTRLASQPQTAGIKTLGRLDQILARNEWQDDSIAEGLMLSQQGAVVCGTMSNLFLIIDGKVLTPEIVDCGVSGVMRQHIIATAAAHGVNVEVKRIEPELLKRADEVFLSNSQVGILPVRQCGQQHYDIGPMTHLLTDSLRASGVIEGAAR